jgi:hypothetical protein
LEDVETAEMNGTINGNGIANGSAGRVNGDAASVIPGTTGNGTGRGVPGSLAARIRRVELNGEWMYPVATRVAGSTSTAGSVSQDQSKSNGDVDGSGNGAVKGKGKQRAEPDFGRSGSGVDGVGAAIEGSKGAHTPAKREEVVRLMLQALRDIGYRSVMRTLATC